MVVERDFRWCGSRFASPFAPPALSLGCGLLLLLEQGTHGFICLCLPPRELGGG
jgi:hypothetical protein